jgi:hypothetical protein
MISRCLCPQHLTILDLLFDDVVLTKSLSSRNPMAKTAAKWHNELGGESELTLSSTSKLDTYQYRPLKSVDLVIHPEAVEMSSRAWQTALSSRLRGSFLRMRKSRLHVSYYMWESIDSAY